MTLSPVYDQHTTHVHDSIMAFKVLTQNLTNGGEHKVVKVIFSNSEKIMNMIEPDNRKTKKYEHT